APQQTQTGEDGRVEEIDRRIVDDGPKEARCHLGDVYGGTLGQGRRVSGGCHTAAPSESSSLMLPRSAGWLSSQSVALPQPCSTALLIRARAAGLCTRPAIVEND